MLPVKDIERARAFYEGCLGFKPGGFKPDGKFVYEVGGSTLALFPEARGHQGRPHRHQLPRGRHRRQHRRAEGAGVVFEDYDFPGFKTVNHVCVLGAEKAAWFKDSEGNYLCIHEDLPER